MFQQSLTFSAIVAQLRKLSPYWSGNGPVEADKAFAPVYA